MPVGSAPGSGANGQPFIEVTTAEQKEEDAKRSYFSRGENGSTMFSDGFTDFERKGHPVHRPTGTTEVLTFYPTREEFKHFSAYIEKVEAASAHTKCGIAKIVPPAGWSPRPSKSNFQDVDNYVIKSPVKELMMRTAQGVYQKSNEIFKKQMTVKEYKQMAGKAQYKPPSAVAGMSPKQLENYLFDHLEDGEPIYGADTEGSIYDEGIEEFNMNRLGTILDEYSNDHHIVIKGVNSVYLYFGMYKTCFPWHSEDMDLYSINYVHFGAPKYWFAIPAEAADRFEKVMDQYFPNWRSDCQGYPRHKLCMISPEILRTHGIPYGTMVQRPNEFIITFPRGYHMGFNTGYNIAESTNFAIDRWIDYGKNVIVCTCREAVNLVMTKYMVRYRPIEEPAWFKYWYDQRITNFIPVVEYPHEESSNKNKLRITYNFDEQMKISEKLKKKRNWLKVSPDLNSRAAPNLFKEREENEEVSYQYPHCAVCMLFVPKSQSVKVKEIPLKSKRYVKSLYFSKSPPPYPEDDPIEDLLLTCSNCRVTVHESCYGGKFEGENRDEWRCFRCRDRNDVAIRFRNCTLCEMRAGALIPCQTGIDHGFIHVVCGIMNRRTSFNSPIGPTQSFTYPSIAHKPMQSILEQLLCQYISAESDYPENSRWVCQVCQALKEGLIVCSLCSETVGENLRTTAHATCGKRTGFLFEERAYPQCTAMVCDRHHYEEFVEGDPIAPGSRVFVLRRRINERGIDDGEIKEVITYTHLSVQNLNGVYISNVTAENVISCSCFDDTDGRNKHVDRKEEHKEGARLTIQFAGKQEDAYYRRQNKFTEYIVKLHNGNQIRCEGKEIFPVGRKMPYSVKKKVNEYVSHPSRRSRFPMYFQ